MRIEELSLVPGIVLAEPAESVAFEVAEALLSILLPSALVDFLSVSDGARVDDVEIFDTDRITEVTTSGAHSWQLSGALVIGKSGVGRALVMTGQRNEVFEVDDDPWDARTLVVAADSPLDLFLRYGGMALREREEWWAFPSIGEAIDQTRIRLSRDVDALLEMGIGSKVGSELPPSLATFAQVDVPTGLDLLASEEFENTLLSYQPHPPSPGEAVRIQWARACEAIADPRTRDLVRGASVSSVIQAGDPFLSDGEATPTELIRDYAFLALLANARDELRAFALGDDRVRISAVGRLAQVFLAGHIPVSLTSAL